MKVGDELGIRGPYGSGFDLKDFYGKDVLFVAGGLGLVPLRSLITPVVAEAGKFGRITLISGCRNPAEELYRDQLKAWSNAGINVIRLVDGTENMPWEFGVGLVTEPIPKLRVGSRKDRRRPVRPAGHVQIRHRCPQRQGCEPRPDLCRPGTAHEMRRGQVRALPDQPSILLSGGTGVSVFQSCRFTGGA